MTLSGNGNTNEVSFPFSGYYNHATNKLTGSTGTSDNEHHFSCDVTDDNDVFMTCKNYRGNKPDACGVYIYKRSERDVIHGSQFVQLQSGYASDMWEDRVQRFD